MIQYSYLRNNLPWQGAWSEIRSFIQNWRKELKLNLNDTVNISFRVSTESKVTIHLVVPNMGCDVREIDINKMSMIKVDPSDYWRLLASASEFLGENAILNSVRVTNELTSDEVFWQRF